jgi:adenine-specific DNA-methyltransferase
MPAPKPPKVIEAIKHTEDKRKNIPTAEFETNIREEERTPLQVAFERRNKDLDPQLVWRGKDIQDWSDLVVPAPALYIQEKVHPKALIDDLRRQSETTNPEDQINLFSDFNGVPEGDAKTEFYQHDANWSNRMILGDSLQVMASLAEREGLRGKVQCIYIDPPYGIKFNSNFQWSTTSRDVKDGNADHITRDPEQVKAFRDTWREGIHSYLTYLRDRLTVSRDLLCDSGSIFVQIGDENVHRIRALMDEVFGDSNFCAQISFKKTGAATDDLIASGIDHLVWFARDREKAKFHRAYKSRNLGDEGTEEYMFIQGADGRSRHATDEELFGLLPLKSGEHAFRYTTLTSTHEYSQGVDAVVFEGREFTRGKRYWSTHSDGLRRCGWAGRLVGRRQELSFKRFLSDFSAFPLMTSWTDTMMSSRGEEKYYVVQTSAKVIQRCLLMTTDPGDLVLDPTCGSGTTAYVAEQWGRRWITIDTSRVALALARARIMGARYPYYHLADSPEGQRKEAEIRRTPPSTHPTYNNIRQGFVYERVPHITLKSIANNSEIDVIYDKFQTQLEPLREQLNTALKQTWQEWQIPRDPDETWPPKAKQLHAGWWKLRIARQKEIDASIAAKAEYEYLYDKPYEDNKKVRVAGPFTVESLSPHRVLGVDENDNLIDPLLRKDLSPEAPDFVQMILENLNTAGVQQAHKEDKINFNSLVPWPGRMVCAEGLYVEDETKAGKQKRAAIFIGPEFGTVSRPDLVEAAREASEAAFDVLIACAFNYDAHSSEFTKLGRIPILKARMNADLHMSADLKNDRKANLFVIFGEPDIEVQPAPANQIRVKLNGVDVFHPNTGEIRSDNADGIACWFIDTDYNEESFFVRQAYFLGSNDPYKSLKTTLRAEINEDAWATLHSDLSRPFDKPKSGRVAVKVINHLGDEVMKVFRVS